jgi:hypothetical protein
VSPRSECRSRVSRPRSPEPIPVPLRDPEPVRLIEPPLRSRLSGRRDVSASAFPPPADIPSMGQTTSGPCPGRKLSHHVMQWRRYSGCADDGAMRLIKCTFGAWAWSSDTSERRRTLFNLRGSACRLFGLAKGGGRKRISHPTEHNRTPCHGWPSVHSVEDTTQRPSNLN